jgi:hypothetical protein
MLNNKSALPQCNEKQRWLKVSATIVSLALRACGAVAESTEMPSSRRIRHRNEHQPSSRCSTAYSYVKIARNAGPTCHATLEFYTTAFDASADRQEGFHGGASRYRAFQTYPSGKGHWRKAVEGISAFSRRVRAHREDTPARRCAVGIRGRQDTVRRP